MSKVKITFKIEVDDNVLINHQIKQDYVASFQKERDLAEEVINKLNTFYTSSYVYQQNWGDLAIMKKQYQEHLEWQEKNHSK